MQTLKALAFASLASLFPLSAEPMPREDVVEIPAKAGPEKEKGIAPPGSAKLQPGRLKPRSTRPQIGLGPVPRSLQ
jgi:hypothetical protein